MQAKPHCDVTQVAVAFAGGVQALPQVPQLCGSVAVLGHEPLQLVVGGGQLVTHFPSAHTWFIPQAMAQPPQLALSVRRLTSHPSKAIMSQSA